MAPSSGRCAGGSDGVCCAPAVSPSTAGSSILKTNPAAFTAAAPASLPEAAASCAAAKKMPAPGAAATSCTGQRFTVVVAHTGKERLALLYGLDGANWRFCNAGAF